MGALAGAIRNGTVIATCPVWNPYGFRYFDGLTRHLTGAEAVGSSDLTCSNSTDVHFVRKVDPSRPIKCAKPELKRIGSHRGRIKSEAFRPPSDKRTDVAAPDMAISLIKTATDAVSASWRVKRLP